MTEPPEQPPEQPPQEPEEPEEPSEPAPEPPKKPKRPKRVRAKPYDAAKDAGPVVDAPEPEPEPAPEAAPEPDPRPTPEDGDEAPDDAESGPPRANHAWPMACHLVTFVTFLTPLGNIGGLLAPLVLWQGFRADDREVEAAAKEAMNFQLNVLLWLLAGGLFSLTCILAPLGFLMIGVAMVANVVLTVLAAVKTANGEPYRYPYIWRPLVTSQML